MKNIKHKIFYYFDDGKIKESRKHHVLITDVIAFKDIDSETLNSWQNAVNECKHLFNEKTDYFIYATILDRDLKKKLIFVRTKTNGWFSFNNNLWDGELDIDNKLNNFLDSVN